MKNLLFVCFALITFASVLPAAASTSVHNAEPAFVELQWKQTAKKKKGYKKPKKKKFLGIFKRKSSCDCPKH